MTEIIGGLWILFKARGHENVRATHKTTLEITKEEFLTPSGDCIVATSSEVALSDLPVRMKEAIRSGSPVVLIVCSGGVCDSVVGVGHPGLSLADPTRIIVRKSSYIDSKTLMICATKSARDLDRRLIRNLRTGMEADIAIGVIDLPQDRLQRPLIDCRRRQAWRETSL